MQSSERGVFGRAKDISKFEPNLALLEKYVRETPLREKGQRKVPTSISNNKDEVEGGSITERHPIRTMKERKLQRREQTMGTEWTHYCPNCIHRRELRPTGSL